MLAGELAQFELCLAQRFRWAPVCQRQHFEGRGDLALDPAIIEGLRHREPGLGFEAFGVAADVLQGDVRRAGQLLFRDGLHQFLDDPRDIAAFLEIETDTGHQPFRFLFVCDPQFRQRHALTSR